MPNLDLESSNAFWKDFMDPSIYRVIAFMETVEDFTYDGTPSLEAVMVRLGKALDQLNSFDVGKEEEFITLCTHLKTSRILRLLQAIDTIDPGSASKMLMYAEEHNSPDNMMASLFLRRNIVFERLRLLSRVFAPDRFNLVLKVLEQEHT